MFSASIRCLQNSHGRALRLVFWQCCGSFYLSLQQISAFRAGYFVGAGVLGLVQNAYVAGAPRKLRVRLGYKGTVAEEIVVRTLVMVEEKYSKLGSV